MANQSKRARILRQIPGYAGAAIMIAFTTFWTFWGAGEMYHEGWWGSWINRLPYLAPIALTLIPTLVALTWPIVGGAVLIVLGIGLAIFFGLDNPMLGGAMLAIGALFLADGLLKRSAQPVEREALPWWRANLLYIIAIGLPVIMFLSMSINMLPVVLTRVDDGIREQRLIKGNEVTLIWAPQGPGWNWQQEWGGYPSWQDVALYGLEPIGFDDKAGFDWRQGQYATAEDMARTNLCRYLAEDGLTLMDEVQDVWHMPTTDELVRSLGRHGVNAGCVWDGERRQQADCETLPDKESPLWATDEPVIYYWTADSHDDRRGYFVAYNGMVNASMKSGGNPRHSYRCVREP